MSDLETRGRPRNTEVEVACRQINEYLGSLDYEIPKSFEISFPTSSEYGALRKKAQGVRTSASLRHLKSAYPNIQFHIFIGSKGDIQDTVVVALTWKKKCQSK